MKKQAILYLLVFLSSVEAISQSVIEASAPKAISELFVKQSIFPIKLKYVNRDVKKYTNDSTYLDLSMQYQLENESWANLPIRIRARGNFRFRECYFAPLKIKIKKAVASETPFKGNKELKLVLPCKAFKGGNDYVVKEYIAYKLYEFFTPYHFKTRLLDFKLSEPKRNKVNEHVLKGFFIEDVSRIADRFDGNVMKRNVHPLQQDDLGSIKNAFFQFMIGNTDFSTGFMHNEKLLFIDKNFIPVPYDFDMSGLCNTSYSSVSQIGDDVLPISNVKQRLYRGFMRNEANMELVRAQILDKKEAILALMDDQLKHFENPKTFDSAKNYILQFFEILEDPVKFKRKIVNQARTK